MRTSKTLASSVSLNKNTLRQRAILARGIAALLVGGSLLAPFTASTAHAADATWTGATSGAWLTTTNWSPAAAPGSSVLNSTNADIASFNAAANPTIGINMNTTLGIYALGALNNTNATARTINNSSTTVPGVLTLNGATVNAIPNTILRNTATTLFTVTNGTSPGTMGVRLGNTSNVIQISGTGGVTIGSNITEANAGSGLTLQGGGTGALTLNGANTFSGPTTISTGTLSLGNVNALQNTSGITIAGGTTLSTTTDGITIGVPITTGLVATNSNILFSRSSAAVGTLTLNGAIGGAGNVVFNTPNINSGGQVQTVALGSANTYGGNTTITTSNINNTVTVRAGVTNALPVTTVLTLNGGNGTGSGRTVALDLNGFDQTLAGLTNTTGLSLRAQRILNNSATPSTLTINNTANFTFSGNLATNATNGNFGLTKSGVGTFTVSGSGGYAGATKITGGILSLGVSNAMQNSPLDTLNSIAGDATNGLQTTVTTLTLGGLTGNKNLADVFTTTAGGYSGVTALTLNPVTGASHSYSANIADGAAGMTLTKSGAGSQTLSGSNSFTGATAVNAGSLTLDYGTQDNSKLSDTGSLTLGNATLNLSGGTHTEIVASTTLNASAAVNLTRNSGAAILQMGAITRNAGATLSFGTSGMATTDTTNVNGILGFWATIGGTDWAANSTNGVNGLITAPNYTDVTRLNGGTQVIADGSSTNVRIVEGTGTAANITLGAATTTINSLTQSTSGGISAATIDPAGQTLRTDGILVATGAGGLTIGTGVNNGSLSTATTAGELLLLSNVMSGLTINSVIADNSTSTLRKTGTGTATLTGVNTYAGSTTFEAGTLNANSSAALGNESATNTLIFSGGTLQAGGAITSPATRLVTLNNTGTIDTNGNAVSIAGVISGAGGFSKTGAGTLTLTGVNTYTGTTTIAGGSVNASSTDNLGNGSATNTLIFNGGTLQASGVITSPSTRGVTMTGNGVIDTNGNAVSLAGVISGTGGLTKNGAGTLTSSAFNTLTGPLTINGGELEFSGNATGTLYASTQININNGAILRITGATGNQDIYNGRNYTFDSVGGGSILVSTGNYNAVSTPFSITTNGGAQNTIGLITTSGAFGFNIGATVATFNVALGSDAASDLTVTPIIANTGSIVKTGAGRLTLTAANTYSGTTTINAGTLRLSGGSAIINAGQVTLADATGATLSIVSTETIGALSGGGAIGGAVTIDTAQTLSLSSGTQTYAGTISGAGTLTNAGAIQTLNGALSHTGGVNVTSGTLTLGSSSNSYTGVTAIGAGANRVVIVTANNALGAIGTGNETTLAGTAGATGPRLGFSGGVNYTATEKVIGVGAGDNRGFIQSVSGSNTFAGPIELSADGASRIGTQDGASLTLAGPITQGLGVTTATILFRVGNTAGDFVTLSNAGNSFGGNSTVFTGAATGYAGVRLGINNALPTNLTITSFGGTTLTTTALDLAGFNQTLNGLSSGSGAGNLNIINQNTITPSTLTLNPTVDKATTNTLILGGGGLGTVNVIKSGTFTQTIGTDNSYTGTTTVSQGKLLLNGNNTAATGAVSVNALATLGGSGTIGGTTTVASTGIVAPGNSAGNLTFGSGLDLSAGGVYSWELGALSVVNPGMDFDTITVSGGNLALAGTSALTLDFALVSPNGPNSADAFWTASKSWKIIDVTTGTNTGDTNLSTITNASYSSGSFTTTVGAGGDLGDIFLVFTPVPAGPPTWIGASGDNWTAGTSWTGTVPNSASAEAQFTTTGGAVANLNVDQTVNKLTFDATTSNDYTISGPGKLTLAGTTPAISLAATNTGDQTITTNVELGAGTTITVSGGSLSLNVPTTNLVLGAGVTATVATGATLNLGGAGNALSNGTTTHANVANNGTLAATSASKRVGNITGTGTTNVTAASATLTATSIRQSVLSIGTTSQVNLTPSLGNKPAGISVFTNTAGTSLSIATGGNFDTNDNDLIVYYQAGQGATTLATIQQQIIDGFLNTPAVAKISSSTGAVDMDKFLVAFDNSGIGLTSWEGVTLTGTDQIIAKYTLFGDLNLDGEVNSFDYSVIDSNFGTGNSWLTGDANLDGMVNSFDYSTVDTHFGKSFPMMGGGAGASLSIAAIPEPSTFVLGGLAVLGLAGYRLRRRGLKTGAC